MDDKLLLFVGIMYLIGQVLTGVFSTTGLSTETVPVRGYVLSTAVLGDMTVVPEESTNEENPLSEIFSDLSLWNVIGKVVNYVVQQGMKVISWMTLDHEFLDNVVGGIFRTAVWVPVVLVLGFRILSFIRRLIKG